MKKIEIITRPDKLDIIKKILAQNEYAGKRGTAAGGRDRQKADAKDFEELNLEMNLLPKIHVMTVVWDEDLEDILLELQQKLTTGSVGDGKIFISTIDDVVRTRTGERGYKTL